MSPVRRAGVDVKRHAALAALAAGLAACTPTDPPSIPGRESPFAIDATMRTTAVATTDVEAMLDALARIEGWHRRENTGVAAALRAGATASQLDALEATLGCKLPEDARALWRWRDGHESPGDAHALVWYHGLLPIDRALADYRALRAADAAAWDPAWFPVLYVQEEWYFVECTRERAAASPVGFYFVEAGAGPGYASLTALFRTQADAMAAGALAADGGGFDGDVAAIAAIHARHNPGVPFPYHVPYHVPP